MGAGFGWPRAGITSQATMRGPIFQVGRWEIRGSGGEARKQKGEGASAWSPELSPQSPMLSRPDIQGPWGEMILGQLGVWVRASAAWVAQREAGTFTFSRKAAHFASLTRGWTLGP